jgi:hypothetical protein
MDDMEEIDVECPTKAGRTSSSPREAPDRDFRDALRQLLAALEIPQTAPAVSATAPTTASASRVVTPSGRIESEDSFRLIGVF